MKAVVDPRRHGRALHAVEDGFEQPPVGRVIDKPRVAQIARTRQDVERVGALAVRLAAVAAGAALQEDLLAVLRSRRRSWQPDCGPAALRGLQFASPVFGERREDVVQDAVDLLRSSAPSPRAASTFPATPSSMDSTKRSRGLEFMNAAFVKSRGEGSRYHATLPLPSPFSPWQRAHRAL